MIRRNGPTRIDPMAVYTPEEAEQALHIRAKRITDAMPGGWIGGRTWRATGADLLRWIESAHAGGEKP